MKSLTALIQWLWRPQPIEVGPSPVTNWKMEQCPNCRVYTGHFVLFTHCGEAVARFAGQIVEWPGLPVDVYIEDPPTELRKHEHGCCFQLAKPNSSRFKLHWARPARSFEEAEAYMLQLLEESLGGKRPAMR
jgi:hypothetical protein